MMELDEAPAFGERDLIDCDTLKELREAIASIRAGSPRSALADLGERRIAALETRYERMRIEPCI